MTGWQQTDDAWRKGPYLIRTGAYGRAIAAFNDHPIGGVHDSADLAMAFCDGHEAALRMAGDPAAEAALQSARNMIPNEED